MAKAIIITEDNQKRLEAEFDLDEGQLDDALGYSLVADFGENKPVIGIFDRVHMEASWNWTGAQLFNDWVEVKHK